MGPNANIKAVITADDRASATLKRFGNNASTMGNKVKAGLKLAAIGIVAAGAAAIAFGVSSVKSFTESENSLAQLNTVLKSTKSIAGVTSKAAIELADSLQKVTKFSDEDVLSAENLLLTFTKIGKDIFPQATKTVLDMSTALGQDTKSSAIQLGKALQDPILGITALRRVGVNFNDAQKDVIANLVETGKSAEAQKLILKELATEFGGSAVAAGKTFSGRLEILKNQFDELKEKVGGFIVNGLLKLYEGFQSFNSSGGGNAVLNTLRSIGDAIFKVASFINIYYKAAWDTVVSNAAIIKESLLGVWQVLQIELIPALKQLWQQVGPVLGPALKQLGVIIGVTLVVAIVGLAKALTLAIQGLSALIRWQVRLYDILGKILGPLWRFQQAVNDSMIGPIKTTINWVDKLISQFDSIIKKVAQVNSAIGLLNPVTAPGNMLSRIKNLVPGFATGGYTGRGGTNEVAGVVHKGEYVVPKNNVDQATGTPIGGRGGSSSTINITVPMMVGSANERRKVARMLIKDIQDLAAMNGKTATDMLGSNYGLVT